VLAAAALASSLAVTAAHAQDKTPGYSTNIPDKIMTPDRVETSIGALDFFDGLPSAATSEKVYDYLDRARGVEAFLHGIAATSLDGVRLGWAELGGKASNDILIFDKLADSNPPFLTANTETVYTLGFSTFRRTDRRSSSYRRKWVPARSTMPTSASSSTWAVPDPTAAGLLRPRGPVGASRRRRRGQGLVGRYHAQL
jgi:hypothetical protein